MCMLKRYGQDRMPVREIARRIFMSKSVRAISLWIPFWIMSFARDPEQEFPQIYYFPIS